MYNVIDELYNEINTNLSNSFKYIVDNIYSPNLNISNIYKYMIDFSLLKKVYQYKKGLKNFGGTIND